jgi:hypothetical protein
VLDVSGATVSGADVGLMHTDGTQMNTMVSEADGEFNFTKSPAGSYLVTVNAKGFAFFTSAEFAVAVQQAYEVLDVSLSAARANMEATVRPTELIAAEQIRAEEKQRLVGFFPNFYTSFIYDAAPLTTKQKFSLATRETCFRVHTSKPLMSNGRNRSSRREWARSTWSGLRSRSWPTRVRSP